MQLVRYCAANLPGRLTAQDLLASLALTAVGLMLTPVIGFFVLLVN